MQCLCTAGYSPHNCQQQPDPALPRTSSKWVTTNSTASIATVAIVAKGDATISAAKAGVVVSTVSNIAIAVTTIAASTTQNSIVACKAVCKSAHLSCNSSAAQPCCHTVHKACLLASEATTYTIAVDKQSAGAGALLVEA